MARSGTSDTKARIQQVARDLFARQGVQHTPLREIAKELGITQAALYYHFSSRDDLVNSIIQPLIDETEDFLGARERGGPLDPRTLFEDYFDLMSRNREASLLLVRDLSTLAHLEVGNRVLEWRRRLNALLIGPDATLEHEVRATMALGGLADCTVAFLKVPVERVRPIAVETACVTLGVP
ncbi:TetR/AcrR family transcriptional regulator [Spiractinospora alimapuensis]|uniref:TetR/AcrR family transcriptional regulator n=1 Tax=Spiractinospora alimapuensis TaxID=2820884 RepID=UPI001F2CF93B|nr:TetR/AcrR family transcriptional regulator [Spiractinospora alimapuensis]QVQ52740.1 TetR/AcrR family transcriptional regulator [Spiractinospora alimapuensis]